MEAEFKGCICFKEYLWCEIVFKVIGKVEREEVVEEGLDVIAS